LILIAGGAGYIGSHTNKLLSKSGYDTIVYDNLSTGNRESVKWGRFIEGDLNDLDLLNSIFEKYSIDAVIHFAASAYVGESVVDPEMYYINNVSNTLNLLKSMRKNGCKKIIFSSTCATYGNPQYIPIDEAHPQSPINPYGKSKLMVEQILSDYSSSLGLEYVSLRYFNAAGADSECELGEYHDPEPHLIPLIIKAAETDSSIEVYGTDYETHDGSAIRDYIHVMDLASAHLAALTYLSKGGSSDVFNLGNGQGFSVFEVIDSVQKVTGKQVVKKLGPRRLGDPEILVGDAKKAKAILMWTPEYVDIETIVKTASDWYLKGGW
jgi:UDP-glucose 4-epimerase